MRMWFATKTLPVWVTLLACSSCTCHQGAPPPRMPRAFPTRPAGFAITSHASPTGRAATATPVRAQTPVARQQMPAAEVPEDFPADVPVYENAELAVVQKLGGGAHNVLFTTPDEAPEIFSFYKEDLRGKGYELTQQYQTKEQSFLSFRKGRLVTNIVIAADPNDKTRRVIAVMYQLEEDVEEF